MIPDYGSALALAKQRWQQWNQFDIADESWLQLFESYGPPATLESIRSLRHCHVSSPELRFEWLRQHADRQASQSTRRTY